MASESKLVLSHNDLQETIVGKVPLDWDFMNAEEYCQRVTDGTHSTPKKTSIGKYLVTSKHLTDGEIDFGEAYLISEIDFCEINKRSKVDQWDVVIGMIGEYLGGVYLEKNQAVDYAIKNVGLFKCSGDKTKGKWLYYYLSSKGAKEYITSMRSGTSQPYITLESLRKFPVIFPKNKTEQEKIISIADSIQNKINLLHDMNKTLETIGKAVFKRWFVDFEFPNQEGKPYKSSGGQMVNSELGEIPKDWYVSTLDKISVNFDSKRVPLSSRERKDERQVSILWSCWNP
jgi:type I restriction enzyme, S subunit